MIFEFGKIGIFTCIAKRKFFDYIKWRFEDLLFYVLVTFKLEFLKLKAILGFKKNDTFYWDTLLFTTNFGKTICLWTILSQITWKTSKFLGTWACVTQLMWNFIILFVLFFFYDFLPYAFQIHKLHHILNASLLLNFRVLFINYTTCKKISTQNRKNFLPSLNHNIISNQLLWNI